MRVISLILSATIALSCAVDANSANCGLTKQFVHKNKVGKDRQGKPIYKNVSVFGDDKNISLFLTADMAVNTDGAGTSYHPDDPAGSKGLAINTICNGANVKMVTGQIIDYTRCQALIDGFREAKDGEWLNPQKPTVAFFAVATKKNGAPCISTDVRYKGYFVSTTSLAADPDKDVCDNAHWLDALEVPFVIIPKKSEFIRRGLNLGDLVVVYHPTNGRKMFAIVGDEGPNWGLAEGSVAIAKTLLGRDNPKTRKETYSYEIAGAKLLYFPKMHIKRPYTAEAIEQAGLKALADWGGEERLKKCAANL